MSLRDSYEALPDPAACSVCSWAATLDESDQQYLREQSANPKTEIRRLYKAAKDNGLPTAETTFRNHVNNCIRNVPGWAS